MIQSVLRWEAGSYFLGEIVGITSVFASAWMRWEYEVVRKLEFYLLCLTVLPAAWGCNAPSFIISVLTGGRGLGYASLLFWPPVNRGVAGVGVGLGYLCGIRGA